MNQNLSKNLSDSPDGFCILEKAEIQYKKNEGTFTEDEAKRVIALFMISVNHLQDYPYFVAKAYRRIGEIYEEIRNIEKTIENFELALKHDPNVGVKKRLKSLDPNNKLCKPLDKKAPVKINFNLPGAIIYLGKKNSCPAGQAPRGVYYEVSHDNDTCVYVKNHYPNDDSLLGSATVTFTTNNGTLLGQEEFPHLIYKFAYSSYIGNWASISFDLKLYFYFSDRQKQFVIDISDGVYRRDEIRYLRLSKNGKEIYFSKGNTLYSLDSQSGIIKKWKQEKEDRIYKVQKKYSTKALSILGLTGVPSNDEIKDAYRKRLLLVHPDLNRDNPRANEETREVINAYEILTNDEDYSENADYHKTVFQGLRVYFPAFGNIIYSIHISKNSNDIYIGYYFGEVIILHSSGLFEKFYHCDRAVIEIKEIGQFLYIVSDKITIFKNRKFISVMDNVDGFTRIIWGENEFVVINGLILKLHLNNGTFLGEIEFRDSISDVYIHNGILKVVTIKMIHEFRIRTAISNYLFI